MFLKLILPWIFSLLMFLLFLFFFKKSKNLKKVMQNHRLEKKDDAKTIKNLRQQITEYSTLVTVCKDLDRRKIGISKDLKLVSKDEYNNQTKFLPRRTRGLL